MALSGSSVRHEQHDTDLALRTKFFAAGDSMSKLSSASFTWQKIGSQSTISIPITPLPSLMSRYSVVFDRIVTPRFVKDVDEIRT